jgi:hypothetical protein
MRGSELVQALTGLGGKARERLVLNNILEGGALPIRSAEVYAFAGGRAAVLYVAEDALRWAGLLRRTYDIDALARSRPRSRHPSSAPSTRFTSRRLRCSAPRWGS